MAWQNNMYAQPYQQGPYAQQQYGYQLPQAPMFGQQQNYPAQFGQPFGQMQYGQNPMQYQMPAYAQPQGFQPANSQASFQQPPTQQFLSAQQQQAMKEQQEKQAQLEKLAEQKKREEEEARARQKLENDAYLKQIQQIQQQAQSKAQKYVSQVRVLTGPALAEFQAADLDGDNQLTVEEVIKSFKSLGLTDDQVVKIFHTSDTNHDGFIQQNEYTLLKQTLIAEAQLKNRVVENSLSFAQVRAIVDKRITDAELMQMFRKVDVNGDDQMQEDEMRELNKLVQAHLQRLASNAPKMRTTLFDFNFKALDADGNGQLDLQELQQLLHYVSIDKATVEKLFMIGKHKNEPFLREEEFEFFKKTVEGFPVVYPEQKGITFNDVRQKVSKSQIGDAELLKLFNYYDRSGDGALQQEELDRLLRRVNGQ